MVLQDFATVGQIVVVRTIDHLLPIYLLRITSRLYRIQFDFSKVPRGKVDWAILGNILVVVVVVVIIPMRRLAHHGLIKFKPLRLLASEAFALD